MPYKQISFNCTKDNIDKFTELLDSLGALSVTYTDAQDQPILEPAPNEVKLWNEIVVCALFQDNTDLLIIAKVLENKLENRNSILIEEIEDRDWVKEWQENFVPIKVSNNFWICPNWCEAEDKNALNLRLDPGLAFGSGTHETTFLCLKWLAENQDKIKDKIVIDYGCGSGILAIGACLLGASKVYAIDYDKQALESTLENAKNNNISDNQLTLSMPEELPIIKSDVIIANILIGPLIHLANKFTDMLVDNGNIVLSGLLKSQISDIQKEYSPNIIFGTPIMKGDWVRLDGQLDSKKSDG